MECAAIGSSPYPSHGIAVQIFTEPFTAMKLCGSEVDCVRAQQSTTYLTVAVWQAKVGSGGLR